MYVDVIFLSYFSQIKYVSILKFSGLRLYSVYDQDKITAFTSRMVTVIEDVEKEISTTEKIKKTQTVSVGHIFEKKLRR